MLYGREFRIAPIRGRIVFLILSTCAAFVSFFYLFINQNMWHDPFLLFFHLYSISQINLLLYLSFWIKYSLSFGHYYIIDFHGDTLMQDHPAFFDAVLQFFHSKPALNNLPWNCPLGFQYSKTPSTAPDWKKIEITTFIFGHKTVKRKHCATAKKTTWGLADSRKYNLRILIKGQILISSNEEDEFLYYEQIFFVLIISLTYSFEVNNNKCIGRNICICLSKPNLNCNQIEIALGIVIKLPSRKKNCLFL